MKNPSIHIVVGLTLMSIGLAFVCFQRDHAAFVSMREQARSEGYAECLTDVSGVIANGGGIDEVLAFARQKAVSGCKGGTP